jgi:hypothetical protein
MVVAMAVLEYNLVFVGGGLAALLLLHELGPALPDGVAVVDPHLPQERPTVHWSYWSSGETPYDRFYGLPRGERVHPLGFAPRSTAGPRHVLLGTKRGLIKPSAGYGIVRIAEESRRLAKLWCDNLPLPPSRQSAWWWRFLDTGFLQLAAHDPRLPLALLQRVMGAVPLAQSLRFIDEDLPPRQLLPLTRATLPVVLGKKR